MFSKMHNDDTGPLGLVGHSSSDGKSFSQRLADFGTVRYAGENIAYGSRYPLQVLLNLLIDDGVTSRGHRKNLLSTNYLIGGLATGYHSRYTTMTTMDFAQSCVRTA